MGRALLELLSASYPDQAVLPHEPRDDCLRWGWGVGWELAVAPICKVGQPVVGSPTASARGPTPAHSMRRPHPAPLRPAPCAGSGWR